MNEQEHEFWKQLRMDEHKKRSAKLEATRGEFRPLADRIRADEPKAGPARRAVDKTQSGLHDCRFALEDIAAEDFGDSFAIETYSPNNARQENVPVELPDAWIDPDSYWTPQQAAAITRCSREKLLDAAKSGKFRVRADKHGLTYQSCGVTAFVDEFGK